jgi:hypothetical protein
MVEDIPTEINDLTNREGKMLFDNQKKAMPSISSELQQEESAVQIASVIDMYRDMNNPTKLKNSKAHNLLMKDFALSNYPEVSYAEMMAKFFKSAGYFLILGYPQIAALIMYDRQNVIWNLQSVESKLREFMITSRAEITRRDNSKQQENNNGVSFALPKVMR